MLTIKYTKTYETPRGFDEEEYHELLYNFIDLVKIKGLTIRQAHKLFIDCADMIMDLKINNDSPEESGTIHTLLQEIATSLKHLEYRSN